MISLNKKILIRFSDPIVPVYHGYYRRLERSIKLYDLNATLVAKVINGRLVEYRPFIKYSKNSYTKKRELKALETGSRLGRPTYGEKE